MKRLHVMGALVASLICFATPVFALQCEAPVVDEAGVFKGRISEVENVAQDLANSGIEVHAFTIRNYGRSRNLDQFVEDTEKVCGGWQNGDRTGHKNNIVIIGIEMADRDMGIYFGDLWKPILNGTYNDIKNTKMLPNLKDGKFVEAFTDAMKEIKATILAAEERRRNPPPIATAPIVVNPVVVDSHAGTTFARVIGFIAFLVAAGLLISFLARGVAERRRREEELKGFRQEASTARATCASFVNSFEDDFKLLKAKVGSLTSLISDEDANPITSSLTGIERDGKSVSVDFGELDNSNNNPSRDNVTSGELQSMLRAFTALKQRADAVRTAMRLLETSIASKRSEMQNAPAKMADASAHVASANHEIAKAGSAGFRTDSLTSLLKKAEAELADANDALTHKRFLAAVQTSSKAVQLANDAAQHAADLPHLFQSFQDHYQGSKTQLENAEQYVGTARAVFEEIERAYVEDSWHPIAGNGSSATNLLALAKEGLAKAAHLASMEEQNWVEAQVAFVFTDQKIAEAVALLDAITSLKKRLDDAKQKCSDEIGLAKANIKKATDYFGQNKADVNANHLDELQAARDHLAEAEAELKKEQPNYLVVVKIALEANKAADRVLEQLTSEHETMERKRDLYKRQYEEADQSISTARDYLSRHHGVVSSNARSLLDMAVQQLGQAREGGRTLDQRIQAAELSDKNADNALAKAKADVRAEEDRLEAIRRREREEEEARERRHRESVSSYSSSHNSSRGSSDSSFGGGSSSWGGSSSSSFGGGSSKW